MWARWHCQNLWLMPSQMSLLDARSLDFCILFFSMFYRSISLSPSLSPSVYFFNIISSFHFQEIIKFINNTVVINFNILNISHCIFVAVAIACFASFSHSLGRACKRKRRRKTWSEVEKIEIKEWIWEIVEMDGRRWMSQGITNGEHTKLNL